MKLDGFQQWLKDTMGLDASTIGWRCVRP